MTKAWHVYLRKGTVFIPTVARTEAGIFMDIDPVAVLERANYGGIVEAIKSVISEGNPIVATPTRATFPKPVVLRYAGVKSWAAFERNALSWSISEERGTFRLCPQRKTPPRGWEDDPTKIEIFDGGSAIVEVSRSLADQIQRTK